MPAMLSTVSLIDPTTLNPSFSGPDTSRMGRPGVIITRADQQTAVDQFQLLLTSAKAYRLQMLALSKAAAGFGYALEKIAHSKASVRDPTNVCKSVAFPLPFDRLRLLLSTVPIVLSLATCSLT